MNLVFGSSSVVPAVLSFVPKPVPSKLETAEDAVAIQKSVEKLTEQPGECDRAYLRAIQFSCVETCVEHEDRKWQKCLERWRTIIMEEPGSSGIGIMMSGEEPERSLQILRELFGNKSVNTVVKTGNALLRFFAWCTVTTHFHLRCRFIENTLNST